MTNYVANIARKLFTNFEYCSKSLFIIKNKAGQLQKLELNAPQMRLYAAIQTQIKAKKPVRVIILKARQLGFSTLTEALIFFRNSFKRNRQALIIAHELSASNNLFEMFKRFLNHLPVALRPQIEHSNEKKLSYKELQSEIRVTTAESGDKVGRSATIQDIHASEVAFWRDAKTTMLALLQTVPDLANTMIILESTANGVSGWFYDTYQAAVSGENEYIPFFAAWHDLAEYSKPLENAYERDRLTLSLTDYEQSLIKTFKLSLEQINWYRYTLKNKCNSNIDFMKQEYPSTADEAFVTSGRPVFDQNVCFENYNNAKKPLRIGDLIYTNEETTVEFVENTRGFIKLFGNTTAKDNEYNVFAAGCDTSEGLEQGDYSIIKVLDRRTNEVCLTWSGHIDPDLLADEQKKIQLFLNNKVYFNTERNNHGLTTIVSAHKLDVTQKYQQNFVKGYEIGSHNELGFKTSSATKPILVNNLAEYIREHLFTDYEKEFWLECMTFVRNEKGQMQAQDKDKNPGTKCFDDRVIAAGLMIDCHLWMSSYKLDNREKEIVTRPHVLKQLSKLDIVSY